MDKKTKAALKTVANIIFRFKLVIALLVSNLLSGKILGILGGSVSRLQEIIEDSIQNIVILDMKSDFVELDFELSELGLAEALTKTIMFIIMFVLITYVIYIILDIIHSFINKKENLDEIKQELSELKKEIIETKVIILNMEKEKS